MTQKKTMAIISATGTARKRTIPAIKNANLCTIVGIHGRNEERVREVAASNGIEKYFINVEEMLDAVSPEMVFIGSPPFLHMDHIKMCCDRGLPVLCEKPLALGSSQAKEIYKHLRLSGAIFRVAHHMRHQPGALALKREILSDPRFGKLRRASLQWGFWLNEASPNAGWKLDPHTGGTNSFYDAGVHALDMMIYLLPPPSKVTAIASSSRFPQTRDNVSALFLCGDALVEIHASQSTQFPLNQLIFDFERASIRVPNAFSERSFNSVEIYTSEGKELKTFAQTNPYGEEIADFIRLIDGCKSEATTIAEAMRGIELLESISASYASGSTIEL